MQRETRHAENEREKISQRDRERERERMKRDEKKHGKLLLNVNVCERIVPVSLRFLPISFRFVTFPSRIEIRFVSS